MKTDYLPPGIHGPSLRWYKPSGLFVLVVRSLWRFWVTGRPVWGRGDNASFLHDATVDYRRHPIERLSRARWRRVAWRWGVAGVPWALADLWLAYGVVWLVVLIVYVTAAGGTLVWMGAGAFRAWWPVRDVRREFVVPTWSVVCRILGEKDSRRVAARSVILPAGFGQDADEGGDMPELSVRIMLPAVPLDEGMKRRIAVSAGERLGIPDVAASWMVKGARAYVDLAPRQRPPKALTYADVRADVLDASPAKPFVGLAAGRKPIYADLDNDGPHIGISAGTGAGKSTLLRLILARRMAAGVGLVVCDYKVISHKWARMVAAVDPSRCRYVVDEDEISEAILAVFAEFSRRREVLKTDASALAGFREVDLLVEELNSLAAMLRKWWGHERRRILAEAKDSGEAIPYVPVVPPAVDALGVLVQAGRELGIHVHVAAQRLDASILAPKDGGAVRESFSNRFLSKYTKKAWDLLAGGVPFEAFPGGPRGIWTAIQDGAVTHFRVPFMSDDEAYTLAMSGEAPAGPLLGGARLIQDHERVVKRLVTLGEAWELVGAPSRDALVKRVQSAKVAHHGMRGNAKLYNLPDLQALQGRR